MQIKRVLISGCMLLVSFVAMANNSIENTIHMQSPSIITSCTDTTANKLCKTEVNGKILRKIFYSNNKIESAYIYYMSGRKAKVIWFDDNEKLEMLSVYPDLEENSPDYNEDDYIFTFKHGKFIDMMNFASNHLTFISHRCDENLETPLKCDEVNFFNKAQEPNLHPVLSLPIEQKNLDVLEQNGIKKAW